MAQRSCDDFKGVGHFEAKLQVEGLCFTLISMDHYMREWLYYNSAAGSFTQRNSVANFLRLRMIFIFKNSFLSHLSADLGVTYTLHL